MMSSVAPDRGRLDALLALKLIFGDEATAGDAAESREAAEPRAADVLALFDQLPPEDRAALEARAAVYDALDEGERGRWIEQALRRDADEPRRLDEHIHPSHIIEALRREPPHIRRFVLRRLPAALAGTVAAPLGVRLALAGADAATSSESAAHGIAEVVRRAFLGNFVSAAELSATSPVDLLTGTELRRLIHLLGVRETASACRGIAEVETVAAFLRRFDAEDARLIASHIASLTELDAERVRLAEETVRGMIDLEADPGAMLYRTGLRVLASSLIPADERRLRYTAQKLPVEAAEELLTLVREERGRSPRSARRARVAEIGSLAARMRGSAAEARQARVADESSPADSRQATAPAL